MSDFPKYRHVNKERQQYWINQWIEEVDRGDHAKMLAEKTPEEAYRLALQKVLAWLEGGYWDWQEAG